MHSADYPVDIVPLVHLERLDAALALGEGGDIGLASGRHGVLRKNLLVPVTEYR